MAVVEDVVCWGGLFGLRSWKACDGVGQIQFGTVSLGLGNIETLGYYVRGTESMDRKSRANVIQYIRI